MKWSINKPDPAFLRRFVFQVGAFAAISLLAIGAMRMNGYQFALSGTLIGEASCLPYTLYFVRLRTPEQVKRGDYVVISMPETDFDVGPKPGENVLKRVSGLGGDHVRIEGTEMWINGLHRDRLWLAKSLPGRQPGDFDADYTLGDDQVFLLGSTQESFDSRYWGPVTTASIIGTATPLL